MVQSLGDVCTSDGMVSDLKGNLYLGDIPYREIVKYKTDGTTEIFLKDNRLLWPDSYALTRWMALYNMFTDSSDALVQRRKRSQNDALSSV